MRHMRLLSGSVTYSSECTSGGILATRLFLRIDERALRAKGDGLPGGPPTTKLPGSTVGSTTLLLLPVPVPEPLLVVVVASPLLEARELRRSLGGGMGDGDDMVFVVWGQQGEGAHTMQIGRAHV